jgi:hypothetical protein
MIPGLAAGILGLSGEILKRIWPDPDIRAKATEALVKAESEGKLRDLEVQLSAIIAEAKSNDPWTSRARPTFLYVVYLMILMAVPMGILSLFSPDSATAIASGMAAWLSSIPEAVWTLFGVGYLGYTGARTIDKRTKMKAYETMTKEGSSAGPTLRDRLF